MIRIGIPNRGRLFELSRKIISRSYGFNVTFTRNTVYKVRDDIEIVCLRSTDIPGLIEKNIIQFGITGNDYFIESEVDIVELSNLNLLNSSLCLLTRKDSIFHNTEELLCGKDIIIYSQYPNIAQDLFSAFSNITIEKIDGSAEAYLQLNICHAVLDIVSSGASYLDNDLKVIQTLLPVASHLYVNKNFVNEHPNEVDKVLTAITGNSERLSISHSTLTKYEKIKKGIASINKIEMVN
ncbi:ATP phosphoribosyltransferase [Robertmurraya siralis]|uniref:ATP phosphoribosyltransferase n=1 Tax=Robertmurraya siralis TaxID=77777 RepID=UPI000BA7BD7D|nr:ATP phosphoribosyltransferase [Robertmurraya siralis]PAE18286.1 ATP phosphoribosyltransferase [Bacillus sp. 7504-2]